MSLRLWTGSAFTDLWQSSLLRSSANFRWIGLEHPAVFFAVLLVFCPGVAFSKRPIHSHLKRIFQIFRGRRNDTYRERARELRRGGYESIPTGAVTGKPNTNKWMLRRNLYRSMAAKMEVGDKSASAISEETYLVNRHLRECDRTGPA